MAGRECRPCARVSWNNGLRCIADPPQYRNRRRERQQLASSRCRSSAKPRARIARHWRLLPCYEERHYGVSAAYQVCTLQFRRLAATIAGKERAETEILFTCDQRTKVPEAHIKGPLAWVGPIRGFCSYPGLPVGSGYACKSGSRPRFFVG